jgi:hypothetical protein
MVLTPPNGRKYIVQTAFVFSASRKAPFGTIITNLQKNEIYPDGDKANLLYQKNPDNKYYTGLPAHDRDKILRIIRASINGLNVVFDENGECAPSYIETTTPHDELCDLIARERPKLTLGTECLIRTDNLESSYTVHMTRG